MIHFGTTSPEYVSLFELTRRAFERLVRARYVGARRGLERNLDTDLAQLDERILEDIGVSRSIRGSARDGRQEINGSLASRNSAATTERLAGRA